MKNVSNSSVTLRDSRTGEFVVVRGVGALKDSPLSLQKGVDLTKPIAAQVRTRQRRTVAQGKSKRAVKT